MGGLQGWYGRFGGKRNLLPLAGHEPGTDQPVATPTPTDPIRSLYAGHGAAWTVGVAMRTHCACAYDYLLLSTTRPWYCEGLCGLNSTT